MFENITTSVSGILEGWGVPKDWAQLTTELSGFVIVILASLLAYFITRKILIAFIHQLTKKSKNQWDDVLSEKRFFKKLSYFVPGYIIYTFTPLVIVSYPGAVSAIQALTSVYMIIVFLMAVSAFLNAIGTIYQDFTVARSKPIKGYLQVIKIIVYIIGIIVIIASLFGKNPIGLIGGLGAFSAVLLLVFKDPILGFVGGIQLSANDMLRPGDWISMPKYGTDGTVIDVALTTVKVQNWDKTISTIPTYSLIEDSFINWRGMEESGGRRIKRAINLDMKSIKFCTREMLERFGKIEYIKGYIENKEQELKQYNSDRNIDNSVLVNGRRQTNIGIFRAYLRGYLTNHPRIHNDMTFLVRQLHPTEKGLPIEIYVFSKIQSWAEYEDLQSDIFDHVLAVIPEFELKAFQNPSGADILQLKG
ncbi:MAG: mechanosensitive ion channel family protein [Bacteroidales bacterium]|nr:mechanosensitive ion channel family protein [Bacteroidales bacterium]